jgi:putative phage-type endonuclease
MRKLDIAQRSPEWLKMRQEKIGASDAPVIMEVSPWSTPYKLWEQKVLGKRTETNAAMERGTDMEQAAREQFEADTGFLIVPCVVLHPKHDWMVASLDGLDVEEKNIVEIKCPGREDHAVAKQGLVPSKYIPQLMHQMEVCEMDKAYYYSFTGQEGVIVILKRDEAYISKMLEAEKEFLQHLQELTPPRFSDKDIVRRQDVEWVRASEAWRDLSVQMEELERQMKNTRETLITLANNQCCQGEGVRLTRSISKGRIDYSSVPQLNNVNLDQYRKEPVESWRISKV